MVHKSRMDLFCCFQLGMRPWLLSLAMGQVLWVDLQIGVKGKGLWIRSVCGEFGEWAKSLDYFSSWLLYNVWILQREI